MSENQSIYLIGEIGVNHNGQVEIAKKLIDKAKESGLNAVKFQSFDPEKTKTRKSPFADYQKENSGDESAFEMSKKLKLSYEAHIELKEYCDKVNIDFLSTGFDNDSVDLINDLGVKFLKIPSGEVTNFPLIQYVAKKNKPMILSTGMSELDEIDKAVQLIKKYNNKELFILHCVSLYPTRYEELNLNFIKTLKSIYGAKVGFSDHSLGIEAGIASVALGAKMIEKHITLDKNMKGPDHKTSLEPEELKQFVTSIRNIEKSLGDKLKRVNDREKEMRKVSRRSIVIEKNISQDGIFTSENLSIKKPGTGISSKYLDIILGRKATKNLERDSILDWDMVGEITDE